MVTIRQIIEEDIEDLARIYIESFPDNTLTLIGPKTCQSYFKHVMDNPAYGILVATYHGKLAGFDIIHLDLKKDLGRRWMFASVNELSRFVIKRYGYVMRRLMFLLIHKLRKKRTLIIYENSKNPSIERQNTAWGELLAVRKDLRRKKIAQHLHESLLTLARENGIRYLKSTVLKSNEAIMKLHEANGAQKFAEGDDFYILIYDLLIEKSETDHFTQGH